MTYAALTFNPVGNPNAPQRWVGQQPDGTLVGVLDYRRHSGRWYVWMIEIGGTHITIDTRQTLPAARRALVQAWQLQLSKGGNP